MAECLMLIEERTMLYHLSGLAVGLLSSSFSLTGFMTSRFPGRGQRLGGRNLRPQPQSPSALVTRSWGYAGQENRFLDSRSSHHQSAQSAFSDMVSPPVDPNGSSVDDEGQEDTESDSGGSRSPPPLLEEPRQSGPPPEPNYFSNLSNPPPPPSLGGTRLPTQPLSDGDETEEDDYDQIVQEQIDRSPSNPQVAQTSP